MASRLFNKLAVAVALIAASLSLAAAPAFADDVTYGTVSSGNIKVSVPTEVPVYVCADGSVLAGDASIANEGSGDVIIDVIGTSRYGGFNLNVSTGSGDSEVDWFSFSNGDFNKPSAKTLSAGDELETHWSVGKLDARQNSNILSAATTKGGAKLATVTYTFREPAKYDFAVFSAKESTLRFYHRASVPTDKVTFDGHEVTNVFNGLDDIHAVKPFNSIAGSVKSIVFVDSGFKPKMMDRWFYNMENLIEIKDLEKLDTSNVTNMYCLFCNCNKLKNLELSKFNTAKVENMSFMFNSCWSLTSLNLSGFDTSSVTDMSNMFNGCSSLADLDLADFGTSSVTDMRNMFKGCKSLTSLNLSDFSTSKVGNMESMFQDCSSLADLDLSGFDTSNVTDMAHMFQDCSKLTSLVRTDFDTSCVAYMGGMFKGCKSLTSLNLSDFSTSKVKYMYSMFQDCSSLADLDLSGFVTSSVTDMSNMFQDCSKLTSLDLSGFDTAKVTSMSSMFHGCGSDVLTIIIGSGWAQKSFPGSSTSTWYGLDGTSYSNTDGIDPAKNTEYHKTNPKAQAAVSEVPVVTEDETAPADSQLVASVDLSTATVLDTQQQGETSESDAMQEPETSSSGSTAESSQDDPVTEEASLQELPAAA